MTRREYGVDRALADDMAEFTGQRYQSWPGQLLWLAGRAFLALAT